MPKPSRRGRHLLQGASLQRKGNATAAAREYRRHLAAYPLDKTAHYHLALALEYCGRPQAAAQSYAKALGIDPYYPEALNNLGILFNQQGNSDAARLCFARALAARPDYSDAEFNYATVESSAGNYQAALLHFARVLEREPRRADAWTNLGRLFLALREPREAQRACDLALSLDPNSPDALWNRSVAGLTLGELPQAWNGFEFRRAPRHTGIPRWNGEPLIGKHLLIHAEQGMGDAIQFLRYCSHVQGGHITIECHPELIPLLAHAHKCIPFGAELPDIDFQIPLMSLPGLFQTNLSSIPAQTPYVGVTEELAVEWNTRLTAPGHSPKVGLVWAGNPNHKSDGYRSIDPALLRPFADLEDVSFFCLQQHPQSATGSTGIPFAGVFDRLTWPDTAAILMNLDLVITVDTAVAHLAGALGRPVWTLLPYAPDWRWMLDRTDSPWYPTMRLFRQPHLNDWPAVLSEVSTALRSFQFDR